MVNDIIIIGAGPAGLSAAVYAKRAMLDTVIIEKEPSGGGQIISTEQVDNYLGLNEISGYDLAERFHMHALSAGASWINGTVKEINKSQDGDFSLAMSDGKKLSAHAVIIATGAKHRKLNIPGEDMYKGVGVSYCATCDGAFYRNRIVSVAGGGDVALEDALYLSRQCKKVYLIHRRDRLRGAKSLQQQVFDTDNIEFIPDTEVVSIEGDESVSGIQIRNKKNGEQKRLQVAGVFIAVGSEPATEFLKDGMVALDAGGYIVAGEDCRTNIPGIFAAGDVRTKKVRQIVTAAADGAVAAAEAEEWIRHN